MLKCEWSHLNIDYRDLEWMSGGHKIAELLSGAKTWEWGRVAEWREDLGMGKSC